MCVFDDFQFCGQVSLRRPVFACACLSVPSVVVLCIYEQFGGGWWALKRPGSLTCRQIECVLTDVVDFIVFSPRPHTRHLHELSRTVRDVFYVCAARRKELSSQLSRLCLGICVVNVCF